MTSRLDMARELLPQPVKTMEKAVVGAGIPLDVCQAMDHISDSNKYGSLFGSMIGASGLSDGQDSNGNKVSNLTSSSVMLMVAMAYEVGKAHGKEAERKALSN